MFGLANRFDAPHGVGIPGPGQYDVKSSIGTVKNNDMTTQLVQKLYQIPQNDPLSMTYLSIRSARSGGGLLNTKGNSTGNSNFDESLTARVARLETSLNSNRTPLCAPGRRRGGAPAPGVLNSSHDGGSPYQSDACFDNPHDAYFQRHSWLAGELNGETFCFKGTSTPAAVGPGSYSLVATSAFKNSGRMSNSHNYLVQRSEEISRNRRDLWIQRRMIQSQNQNIIQNTMLARNNIQRQQQQQFQNNQNFNYPGQAPGQQQYGPGTSDNTNMVYPGPQLSPQQSLSFITNVNEAGQDASPGLNPAEFQNLMSPGPQVQQQNLAQLNMQQQQQMIQNLDQQYQNQQQFNLNNQQYFQGVNGGPQQQQFPNQQQQLQFSPNYRGQKIGGPQPTRGNHRGMNLKAQGQPNTNRNPNQNQIQNQMQQPIYFYPETSDATPVVVSQSAPNFIDQKSPQTIYVDQYGRILQPVSVQMPTQTQQQTVVNTIQTNDQCHQKQQNQNYQQNLNAVAQSQSQNANQLNQIPEDNPTINSGEVEVNDSEAAKKGPGPGTGPGPDVINDNENRTSGSENEKDLNLQPYDHSPDAPKVKNNKASWLRVDANWLGEKSKDQLQSIRNDIDSY